MSRFIDGHDVSAAPMSRFIDGHDGDVVLVEDESLLGVDGRREHFLEFLLGERLPFFRHELGNLLLAQVPFPLGVENLEDEESSLAIPRKNRSSQKVDSAAVPRSFTGSG